MKIFKKWMMWAWLEAAARSVEPVPQKLAARSGDTTGHAFFITMIAGLVQVIAGFVVTRTRKIPLMVSWRHIRGSVGFGLGAFVVMVLVVVVFQLDGDIGVVQTIASLAIVPAAIFDRVFFHEKLSGRQWFGVLVAVFAGYSVLGWPSLAEIGNLPTWVWFLIPVPLIVAFNQVITRDIKDIDPFVKSFWGGLAVSVCTITGVIVVGSTDLFLDFSWEMGRLWFWSAIFGIVVIGIWTTNLMGYKRGATIAIKKLIVTGTELIVSMTLGILLFGEPKTFAKAAGVTLFIAAFVLVEEDTWEWVTGPLRRRRASATP